MVSGRLPNLPLEKVPRPHNQTFTNTPTKTDLYKKSSSIIDDKITYHIFSEVDNVEHARLKRAPWCGTTRSPAS